MQPHLLSFPGKRAAQRGSGPFVIFSSTTGATSLVKGIETVR